MLGEEVIYWYGKKLCAPCAAQDAASRREAAGEAENVLAVTRRHLDAGGRVILTRRQLRELITLACAGPSFAPVRKPDAGTGRQQWYGRMPGWATGTKEGETSSWHLVHFIRQLPKLTGDDIAHMESLNPRSLQQVRQQIEEEKFLQGGP